MTNSYNETPTFIQKYLTFSFISLLLVGGIGVLMRYKIGFSFPYFEQKNLLHAHSHLAFNGWVSMALMTLMTRFLFRQPARLESGPYRKLLFVNALAAIGMLISFAWRGYHPISIAFSTLSLLNTLVFAYYYIKDLRSYPDNPALPWFKAAMFYNILSMAGTLYLSYMMVSHTLEQHSYLASVYWFLHFQYNGWFTFACAGLLIDGFFRYTGYEVNPWAFRLFFLSCIPAYGLSILWMKLPMALFILVCISSLTQLIGWILLWKNIKDKTKKIRSNQHLIMRMVWVFLTVAFSIKILLQFFSTFPEISKLAFGFRPIVIAYLHLILLGVISVFILGYSYGDQLIRNTQSVRLGIRLFLFCVLLNELFLGIQGIASFKYIPVPFVNEALFAVALGILASVILILTGMSKKKTV